MSPESQPPTNIEAQHDKKLLDTGLEVPKAEDEENIDNISGVVEEPALSPGEYLDKGDDHQLGRRIGPMTDARAILPRSKLNRLTGRNRPGIPIFNRRSKLMFNHSAVVQDAMVSSGELTERLDPSQVVRAATATEHLAARLNDAELLESVGVILGVENLTLDETESGPNYNSLISPKAVKGLKESLINDFLTNPAQDKKSVEFIVKHRGIRDLKSPLVEDYFGVTHENWQTDDGIPPKVVSIVNFLLKLDDRTLDKLERARSERKELSSAKMLSDENPKESKKDTAKRHIARAALASQKVVKEFLEPERVAKRRKLGRELVGKAGERAGLMVQSIYPESLNSLEIQRVIDAISKEDKKSK